jgi:hypothetical protein
MNPSESPPAADALAALGDELVIESIQRLIGDRELAAYEYDGLFEYDVFQAMDTLKDKQQFDDLYESGQPPWEVTKSQHPDE